MRGLISSILFIVVLLILGTAAASHFTFAAPQAAAPSEVIPDEAIRIRIIAQSDSAEDQAIKQAVRANVSAVIESWGPMPSTIEAARKLIRSHLPDVQKAADETLQAKGADYGAKVELGVVPFPDKTFEGEDYPAGDYEALRITLGEGEGANWWCVLFPPLCLTAATAQDDAKAKDDGNAQNGATDAHVVQTGAKVQAAGDTAHDSAGTAGEKPKAEFFLWVLLKKLIAWVASLFS